MPDTNDVPDVNDSPERNDTPSRSSVSRKLPPPVPEKRYTPDPGISMDSPAPVSDPEPDPKPAPPVVLVPPPEDDMSFSITGTKFWAAVFERALRTYAQAVLALMGTGAIEITDLDWKHILLVGATAAVASVLFSLINALCSEDPNPAVYERPNEKITVNLSGK